MTIRITCIDPKTTSIGYVEYKKFKLKKNHGSDYVIINGAMQIDSVVVGGVRDRGCCLLWLDRDAAVLETGTVKVFENAKTLNRGNTRWQNEKSAVFGPVRKRAESRRVFQIRPPKRSSVLMFGTRNPRGCAIPNWKVIIFEIYAGIDFDDGVRVVIRSTVTVCETLCRPRWINRREIDELVQLCAVVGLLRREPNLT